MRLARCWLGLGLAAMLAGCPRPAPKEAIAAPTATPGAASAPGMVTLEADAQTRAGVQVAPAEVRALSATLVATGEFEANADREAHVTPRVAGRVVAIHRTVGDRVRAGEPLAAIDSLPLGRAEADYLEAEARQALTRTTVQRVTGLYAGELTARKEVLAAEHDARIAQIGLERTRNELKLLGLSEARVAELARTRRVSTTLPLLAPVTGIVTARHLTLGELLDPGAAEPAYVIQDPSALWMNADLYERDLARVKVGQAAEVDTPAYPGRVYRGRVALVSAAMDRETRTAKARIVVTNSDGRLKPEMFATVRLQVGTARRLALPQAAVQQDETARFVFVRVAPTRFRKQVVQLGEPTDGWVPVEAGLAPGEAVVVAGGFTLKSELLKAGFGEHGD